VWTVFLSILGITLVVAVAGGVARGFVMTRALERGLRRLRAGERVRPILLPGVGPLGRLARVFNEVVPEIQSHLAQLEGDGEQLRVVLGAMAEAVIAVDSRMRLLFANTSADRLFGLESASVGRLIPELIRSPQVQAAIESTLRMTGPSAYRGEITLAPRDAQHRQPGRLLSVQGNPLPGDPAPAAVLVFHDVTELRRLERMRQDFVANASHELKTPLASIKAYTETLLDWALHDEAVNVRFLQQIEEQADRLNQLILDLLSLARLEAGQDFFQHEPLRILPVLEACIEAHRGRAESKGLNLERLILSGVEASNVCVVADEEAIQQIFDNLIDNAIKYTSEGGTVRLSLRVNSSSVEIEISDTGLGIPRDDLPRIFERFYRVDKARSRELGGTGLGLSIVKHLVQSIGGRIGVSSRVGSGSRFNVQLPRSQVPAAEAHKSSVSTTETP
jgi:two-component system phosphate regulon sensor histidine kinase PhoR